jgi:hypothetical protein
VVGIAANTQTQTWGAFLWSRQFSELCLADTDSNGTIDFFDYLDFVDAFARNSSSADFNNDGFVNFFDYLDFVDAFSMGC